MAQQEDDGRDQFLAREQAARLAAERAQAMAEAAVQVRDTFLYTVSHDLKNPLMAIKLRAQVHQRLAATLRTPEGERLSDAFSGIDATATRMARMIDGLLDLARLQAGYPLPLERRSTDLVALVRSISAEHQLASSRHQIIVQSSETELIGLWDAGRVERVLDNLLSNATKYSPGGGAVTVTVRRAEEGWALMTVQDSGVGIPAADVPHIFEPFHRAGNVGRATGTGVGLAGVRQTVEEHGGVVSVDSREGAGTTVTVRLPLGIPTTAADTQ